MKIQLNKPDFFSIGPAKSGTSWQLHHFCRHPQIKEPLIKDLNFFDQADLFSFIQKKTNNPSRHEEFGNYFDLYNGNNLKDFEFVLNLRKIQQRQNFRSLVNVKNFVKFNFSEIAYGLRFWSLKRELNQACLEEYCNSLFKGETGKLGADLSTNYFNLSKAAIQLIHNNFPSLKIIIGIRNPIERRWSYLRMEQNEIEKSNRKWTIDQKMAELPDPDGDYKRAILNWTSYFPLKQIYFAFFDELIADPLNYLKGIYDFLEIEFDKGMVDPSYRNKGIAMEIPYEIHRTLLKNLSEQFHFLSTYFPNNQYIQNWREFSMLKEEAD